MRQIICECDICNKSKTFNTGDIEMGFRTLSTGLFGTIFICEECDNKLVNRTFDNYKKSMKYFESFCKEFNEI